jgi:hypothetical protein
MGTMTTKDRPDKRYYKNIVQGDDGNWSSDPMSLDDVTVQIGNRSIPTAGLRTMQSNGVSVYALNYIRRYAPEDAQRNAIYILSTQTSGTAWTNAKAMMDWIASVNAFRDNEITTNVRTLNFNQLIAYTIPAGTPPWPAPPASLSPASSFQLYANNLELRLETGR